MPGRVRSAGGSSFLSGRTLASRSLLVSAEDKLHLVGLDPFPPPAWRGRVRDVSVPRLPSDRVPATAPCRWGGTGTRGSRTSSYLYGTRRGPVRGTWETLDACVPDLTGVGTRVCLVSGATPGGTHRRIPPPTSRPRGGAARIPLVLGTPPTTPLRRSSWVGPSAFPP